MSPGEFLRSVWPSEGIYCLAIPRGNGAYRHWTYDTIDEAAARVESSAASTDVYFCIHALKEKQVPRIGEEGKPQVRVQRNMRAARCFFWDIDVEPNNVLKYGTQKEAFLALTTFLKEVGLPRPTITSSGGGLHIYFHLTDEIASDEWRDTAAQLRQLAQHYGLKIDRSRTTDTSSVLRVAGTFNHKNPLEPRPVKVVAKGKETGNGVFIKAVRDALIRADVAPVLAPKVVQAESLLGSNLATEYDGPRPTAAALFTACGQMKRLATMGGEFSESEWYYSAIGVGRFTNNPGRFIHKLSAGHRGYSHASCEAKIKQSEARQRGPSSCATVAARSDVGDTLCAVCPHQGKVFGPIQAALWADVAPPPVVEQLVGEVTVSTEIPDPPRPFTRLKSGGVAMSLKNADGEEASVMLYEYDLYPVRRLVNPVMGIEQHVWHAELPRGEAKDFTLDADMLYDLRKFVAAISNHGVFPTKGNLNHLQDYMVAYISQLQRMVDADAQCNHLGWADEYRQFILPDKVIAEDGTMRPAQLSLGAQRASANVAKRGTLERQIEVLRFFDNVAYLPNQFFILAGLAAPLFYMTGHHGVIINASGDAGASKSTSLYTAASFWGQPELYPINGTNNGATVRGRNERVTVLANLPICVDEITHMPVKDAVDLAMSITQPGHRIRLQTDGVERAAVDSYKATIMLTTANSSLHGVLSTDNTAGTAGSMRVFEITFRMQGVHAKHEADDFMDELKANCGHLGEVFIRHAIQHRDRIKARLREIMREIDVAANIKPSERFWSAVVAAVLTTAEIGRELGLTNYSPDALKRWAVEKQIPFMRGVVREEYSDPLAIVSDYLEQINNNMLVVNKNQTYAGASLDVQRHPHGALLAHYDMHDRMLYVLKKGFKDYCVRIGANATSILDALGAPSEGSAVIPARNTRRTLGAGTDYAKGQSWCFSINMAHRDISGAVDLELLQGGSKGGSSVEASGLQLVQ